MSNAFFPILGTDDIPLIGRKDLLDRIWSDLTKATPTNLSIVGPKHIGKTVLLKALVDRARQNGSPYSLVVYWELGHTPPQSDGEFVQKLCDHLYSAMGANADTYKEARKEIEKARKDCSVSLMLVREIMEELQEYYGQAVLMIWDGFDKPISQGRLTGTLFGNLRDLFHGSRHRLVTATRQSQTELARSIEVEDSPFWEMFGTNFVRVGPFDDDDLNSAIAAASLTITQGGKTELSNWTGGHPVLFLSLLNKLIAQASQEFDNTMVNEVAKQCAVELMDFLDRLWSECNSSTRNAFLLISDHAGVESDRIGKEEARYLLARGFVVRAGTKIVPSCRMFAQHVHGSTPDTSTLDRMFGTWDAYRNEIRSILERRIKQIRIINARLHRLVSRCLDDIPDHAVDCLNNLNSIEDLALELVWNHEFGNGQSITPDVQAYWTQPPRDQDFIIQEMMRANNWRRPLKPFDQLKLLQRLTGCTEAFDSRAKRVSKDCYVLLNAIHAFRNRTVHPEGQPIHEGVAVAAVLLCIELLSCLERELG